MVLIKNLCNNISRSIQSNVKNIDDEKAEVINYGLYLFFSDGIKTIIVLSIAYYFNVFWYTITAIAIGGLLRTFSGGVHAKSWLGCLLSNSIISFSTVYLAIYFSDISKFLIASVVFPISFTIIYLYAPSDHENKPVVSKKQRKFLRKVSFLILISQYILALTLLSSIFANIIVISTFITTIAMLPVTYTITRTKHGNLES